MDELISRKVLKRWLEMNKANANPLDYNTKATYAEFITMVDSMEAIDAEPVRHGKWINKKRWSMGKWHKWLECSECNYQDYNLETYEAIPFTGPSNYCPNCGAKMK